MKEQTPSLLFSIITALKKAKISYSLAETREDAITILAAVPGERWEIDVFNDGEIAIEVFQSDGKIFGICHIDELIRQFGE